MDPYVFDAEAVYALDDYLYFYDETLRAERTPAQVDRVLSALALRPPARVIDLGCGHGRHAIELARRGFDVTAVDQMQPFLDRGAADARAAGVSVRFERADLRALSYDGAFDAAVCLFDAFGAHRDDENVAVLANMARALRVGGGFCLDLRNRDWMARNLLPITVLERDGNLMIDRHAFDSRTGRLVDRRVIVRDGRTREAPLSTRLYTCSEIERLLRECGLTVREALGDWSGLPVSVNHNRLVLFGARAR